MILLATPAGVVALDGGPRMQLPHVHPDGHIVFGEWELVNVEARDARTLRYLQRRCLSSRPVHVAFDRGASSYAGTAFVLNAPVTLGGEVMTLRGSGALRFL